MANHLATLLLSFCFLQQALSQGGIKLDKVRENAGFGVDGRRNEDTAPSITEHPSSESVSKNSPATLNCGVSGYPEPVITWLKDGQPLESSTDGHRLLMPSGALFFLRVIPRLDIGSYQCVATNTLGSAYSENATLDIAYLRGDFRQSPSDTTAFTEKSVVLECTPPRGHPPPEVSWERNGETVVADGGRIKILPDGNLVISPPRPSDQGNYVCVATNSEGAKRSAPGRLTVRSRPTFTTMPEDTMTIPGETITLPCVAEGEPEPTIRWTRSGGILPEGRHTILKDNSLRIRNADVEDSGMYICTAHNTGGERSVQAHIIVSAAPMFTRKPVDRTVVVGQEAFFLCQAMGQPAPSIYWKDRSGSLPLIFPGEIHGPFKVTNDGRLHIRSVTREDEGYYNCVAMSPRGTVVSSAYLRVLDEDLPLPPIIHVGPSNQTLVEGTPAKLVCQAEGSTAPSINWFKDGQPLQLVGTRITQDSSGTLIFLSLSPDDAGLYTCSAANSVGATRSSASLQVIPRSFADSTPIRVAPTVLQLPQAPGFPFVDNITRTTMRLSWPIAEPLDDRIIALTGYRIEYFTPDQLTGWTLAAEGIQGNSFTVRNLQPGFTYVFMVRGINDLGFGPPGPVSISLNTESPTRRENPGLEVVPGEAVTLAPEGSDQRDVLQDKLDNCGIYIKKAEAIGTTSIKVVWQVIRNEDYIDGYHLQIRPVESSGVPMKRAIQNAKVAVQSELQPWTRYQVSVVPFHGLTHFGTPSASIVVRTAQDVPRAPPQFIRASQNGSTSITVSWQPPPPARVPGIIVGYHVFCISVNPPRHTNVTTRDNRTKELAVAGLTPGLQYGVKVAAYTIAGMGPFSDIVYVTLPPGPDDPSKRLYEEETAGGNAGPMDAILSQPWFYAAVALALLFVVVFIFVLVWRRHRKKPCSPVTNGIISKENGTVQNMVPRPSQLNGTGHGEAETSWTSTGPHTHTHTQHGCIGNCCTGNGSSGDDTLEKNKPPPAKWPNGAPPVWLQEVYNPKYPSHLQSQVSKETHLTHDSQSSSGFGSSFPTLSTFHGMMMHPSSPEYAVVENEAELDEELSYHHAGGTLPMIPSPGSNRPPPQYSQHPHHYNPHHQHHQLMDDPEPYASATVVSQTMSAHGLMPRRQNCSDTSSEWSGSWQSARTDGRRPGRMVKAVAPGGGHGSPRGWHPANVNILEGPPIPERDMCYSDQSNTRCSSASKRNRHPLATTPGRQPQRNWAEFLPPPPEQPPTDMDSPGSSLPPSHQGSIKSSYQLRRGSSPNQPLGGSQQYVQIDPAGGMCEDCNCEGSMSVSRCPPVPPRNHQQSPHLNQQQQSLSGHNSPVPIIPPPLLPKPQTCRTEIPGPGSHFQPIITSLSPPPGMRESPVQKQNSAPVHRQNRTPPPATTAVTTTTMSGSLTPPSDYSGANSKQGSISPMDYNNRQGVTSPLDYGMGNNHSTFGIQTGADSPSRGVQGQYTGSIRSHGGGYEDKSIASQRLFEDPRHAQIGQELLKYMSKNELDAMSDEAQYAAMEMDLKHTEGSPSAVHPSLCEVQPTELTPLDRDMDTASNCTGSMMAYGSSSNGSRRNSAVSTSSDESFFDENNFSSAVAAAAQNLGVSVVQRGTPVSSTHLLQEDTV